MIALLLLALAGILAIGVWMVLSRQRPRSTTPVPAEPVPPSGAIGARARARVPLGAPPVEQSPAPGAPFVPEPRIDGAVDLATWFHSQDRDPVWAASAEEEIRKAFAATPSSMLESVECRAWLCKITAVHGDALAHDTWMSSFPELTHDLPGMVSQRSDRADGTVQTDTYLAAKGHALPTSE